MMKGHGTKLVLLAWALVSRLPAAGSADAPMSLAGEWRFALDREGRGIAERWFDRTLPGRIRLPGALVAQGVGDDVTPATKWVGGIVDRSYFTAPEYEAYRRPGNIKVPFWLQPEKTYGGAAWYQRTLEIPPAWAGRRVELVLERPHWQTRAWLDDRELGSNDSLSTPHAYDLGPVIAAGRHQLTIRVDNSVIVDVGVNSHSISDHTQGNWNGIVGRIELASTAPIWVEDLQVYPRVESRSAWVRGRLRGNVPGSIPTAVALSVETIGAGGQSVVATAAAEASADGAFERELALGSGARLWDEFTPALYRLLATPAEGEPRAVTFGFREISTRGTQFLLNGRRVFFRGTLECCIFPRTGYPPTEVAEWRRVLSAARAHGLNTLRFHSWCPPEAAFVAADEMGMYFHVEAASWPNQSTTLGDGEPVDAWLEQETRRILRAYGNHPSFVLMASSNEPGGRKANAYLRNWVQQHQAADPRRLFTSGAGWPELPENQFHVSPKPRIQGWGAGLASRLNASPPETRTDYRAFVESRSVPVISHEIGQWCVYPNFAEMPKYTGYLKPRNFEIFRDSLQARGMGGQAAEFLQASGKLQALCYKEEIESALRTPGMGGFELLDLHDFPGQGTALVGVLDAFWEEKGYVSPKEFRRFCNSTVPLARLDRRVFTAGDSLEADLEIAHYGPAPLTKAVVTWRLVADGGGTLAAGRFTRPEISTGGLTALGRVSVPLRSFPTPGRARLIVGIEGTDFENDWDIWVYPQSPEGAVPPGIRVVEQLDAPVRAELEAGGTVLLAVPPKQVRGDERGEVALGFSSIFWNTAWTKRQPPHTLGILCDPRHPALALFPTDFHSNWQWWYPLKQAGAMILDGMPQGLRPIVQVIDDWVTNRKLALVFEGRVGRGRLLVCSIDLQQDQNPVIRQLRASLLRYVATTDFAPSTALTAEQVRGLMRP